MFSDTNFGPRFNLSLILGAILPPLANRVGSMYKHLHQQVPNGHGWNVEPSSWWLNHIDVGRWEFQKTWGLWAEHCVMEITASDTSQPPQRSVIYDARCGVFTCYSTVADTRRNDACQAAAGVEEKLHFPLAVYCCRPKLCEDWSIMRWRLETDMFANWKNNLISIRSESFSAVRI